MPNQLFLLKNKDFIRWCYEAATEKSLINASSGKVLKEFADIEKGLGNIWIGAEGEHKQWTTRLCQEAVREVLISLGYKNVKNSRKLKSTVRNKGYDPDLESDEAVWEVKGRGWTTPGTAGEKILGTPMKYSELPELYGKPLKIVLVGYQEYEAKHHFACGDLVDELGGRTRQLGEIIDFYKNKGIEYVAFTDLLTRAGYPYGCWENN
ncbi:hypothetical protein GW846_01400 [Candidatus Gracilibacteria bacterium]|nr:hypothetical protein [Candidatus Gracilibacteria bacterium]